MFGYPQGRGVIRFASMVSLLVHATILALPRHDFGLPKRQGGVLPLQATLVQISRGAEKPADSPPALLSETPEKSKTDKRPQEPIGRADSSPKTANHLHHQPAERVTDSPEALTDSNRISNDKSDDISLHYPSSLLDRPPVPYSAPDARKYLTGTSIPALPVHLRLYIDKSGKVIRINAKAIEYMDESLLTPVKEMFFATAFIPGNIKGVDVPSYIDIEVELSEFIR